MRKTFKSFKKAVLLARIRRLANKCHDVSVAKSKYESIPYENEEVREIWEERYEELSVQDIRRRIPSMTLMEMLGELQGKTLEAGAILKKKIAELYLAHTFATSDDARKAYSDAWDTEDVIRKRFWSEFIRLTKKEASNCTSIEESSEAASSRASYSEVVEIWRTRCDELYFQDALKRAPQCFVANQAQHERQHCWSKEGREVWNKRFAELSDKEAPMSSTACESIEVAVTSYNDMVEGTLAKEVWGGRLLTLVKLKLKTTEDIREVTNLYRSMSKIGFVVEQLNLRYMELFADK